MSVLNLHFIQATLILRILWKSSHTRRITKKYVDAWKKPICKEQGHCKEIKSNDSTACLCCPAPTFLSFPRAPVAVGVATMSTEEMLAAGMKGKGFAVLHTHLDHLWWVPARPGGNVHQLSCVHEIQICAPLRLICQANFLNYLGTAWVGP